MTTTTDTPTNKAEIEINSAEPSKEYFEFLTYDEKIAHLKNELLSKKSILQNTKNEYNLKILLDIWRSYHLEQLEKIQTLIERIDKTKALLVGDLVFINKVYNIVKSDNIEETQLTLTKQKITAFYQQKTALYTSSLPELDTALIKYATEKADLEKNLNFLIEVLNLLLKEPANTANGQNKQLLLECQRLENALLSTYAALEMIKLEQDKIPLVKQHMKKFISVATDFAQDIANPFPLEQLREKVINFANSSNNDTTLEAILELDTAQRTLYKKSAICQRLVAYRTHKADYTKIPPMLNITDHTFDEAAIASMKLQVTDQPKINHDKILELISENYFNQPLKELTQVERYFVENEIMAYAIKNLKHFNNGIDSSYKENLDLPLPKLAENKDNQYHTLVQLSILHYNIDASINSLNDKLIRLSMQTSSLIKKINLTLTDLGSFSKLVEVAPSRLEKLYADINTLSEDTNKLEQSLTEKVSEIKQQGIQLLNNFEQYKITLLAEDYTKVMQEVDNIKATINHNYKTFANNLSDLLAKHANFIDKADKYKEELIQLGKEGKLKSDL